MPWWLYCWQGDEQRQADLSLDLFFRMDSCIDILARKGEHDAHKKTAQRRQEDHDGPGRLALALRGYRLIQHLKGRFIPPEGRNPPSSPLPSTAVGRLPRDVPRGISVAVLW